MFSIMDKNGRIIQITAKFYGAEEHAVRSPLSAEEVVISLFEKLPEGEFIRGAVQEPAK